MGPERHGKVATAAPDNREIMTYYHLSSLLIPKLRIVG